MSKLAFIGVVGLFLQLYCIQPTFAETTEYMGTYSGTFFAVSQWGQVGCEVKFFDVNNEDSTISPFYQIEIRNRLRQTVKGYIEKEKYSEVLRSNSSKTIALYKSASIGFGEEMFHWITISAKDSSPDSVVIQRGFTSSMRCDHLHLSESAFGEN